MKKKGTVKTYKMFPVNSLSYKLEDLEETKKEIRSCLIRFSTLPIRTYLYVTMGNAFGKGWLIAGAIFETFGLIEDILNTIKNKRQLKSIKRDIVERLSEIEPEAISNDEDKKTLEKRI